jgi:pyridoxal phosphate enzyme (YggS family)
MPFLADTYQQIIKEIEPQGVTLVAVSKTKPLSDILDAYQIGARDFGENYVQELVEKYENGPKDIRWHFIGHLQSNKVKYIAPFVHLIHGIDSEKLLIEINKQGKKVNRKINCLLQVHIAQEETKFGLDENELKQIMNNLSQFEHVTVIGVMGMASFSNNQQLIEKEFSTLKQLFDTYQHQDVFKNTFKILSMGMSADYKIAIAKGSNMIRVGSILFGERNKHH